MSNTAAVQSTRASARISPDMWRAAWTVTSVFMLSNSPTPLYVVWQRTLGFSSGTLTVISIFSGSTISDSMLGSRGAGRRPQFCNA